MLMALLRQIEESRVQDRAVVHIRVTTDALPGTIAALPLTPERLRTVGRMRVLPGGTVAADPEPTLEIVVHPEDWFEVLKDPWIANVCRDRLPPCEVMGVPVVA